MNIGDDTAAVELLGGSLGDIARDASLVGQASTKLPDGDTALTALAQETDEDTFNVRTYPTHRLYIPFSAFL
ncbi:MAG: hypothetical protein II877_10525 [Synergistaceae bacterium]|nr:hypothetical protein [Synergistaceae bacterium]